VKACNDNMKK